MSKPSAVPAVIKVGDKEIELNDELYRIIHDHYKTGGTLDTVAEQLNLEGWDEAYRLISAMPQWMIWFTPSQFEEKVKGERKPRSVKRHTRRHKTEAAEEKEQPAHPESDVTRETEPSQTTSTANP